LLTSIFRSNFIHLFVTYNVLTVTACHKQAWAQIGPSALPVQRSHLTYFFAAALYFIVAPWLLKGHTEAHKPQPEHLAAFMHLAPVVAST